MAEAALPAQARLVRPKLGRDDWMMRGFMVVIGLWKVVPFLRTRDFAWRSIRVLLAGAAMFVAAWPLRDQFLLVPIAVGSLTYVAAILLLRALTDDERHLVGTALARVGLDTRWSDVEPTRADETDELWENLLSDSRSGKN